MKIPFFGGYAKGRSPNAIDQECMNVFLEVGSGGVNAVYGTPGLKVWLDLSVSSPVRGLRAAGGYLFAVVGNNAYKIDADKNATLLTGEMDTELAQVFINENGFEVLAVDGVKGYSYVFETEETSEVGNMSFITPKSMTFQDGYFIVVEEDSQKFWISGLYDVTAWNALDFASAESKPDKLVTCLSDHQYLWLFGERSTEVWANTGAALFPFARVQGSIIEMGCGAKSSAAPFDNDVVWLTDHWQIVKGAAGNPQIISTRELDYQIGRLAKKDDAIAFSYIHEGHWFYQINFPTANVSWAYDAVSSMWHQRASYPSNGRHRANCLAWFGGKNLVGDWETGIIYELDSDTYTDNGEEITRLVSSGNISQEGKLIFFKSLRVEFEGGVGLNNSIPGLDPLVWLSWTDDKHTWSNNHLTSIGKIGAYGNLANWQRLGCSRSRRFLLGMTDPVKFAIVDAYFDAETGRF